MYAYTCARMEKIFIFLSVLFSAVQLHEVMDELVPPENTREEDKKNRTRGKQGGFPVPN